MNYYEIHIGDYIKATAHLSMLEDAAYRRLMDAYYTREAPLPLDRKAVHKLARAQSKDERAAVDYVLDEFFTQADDGWHQSRCDEEIMKYHEKAPRVQEKRETPRSANSAPASDGLPCLMNCAVTELLRRGMRKRASYKRFCHAHKNALVTHLSRVTTRLPSPQ